MATNLVQKGGVIDLVAAADLVSGTPVLIGDILGVPLANIANTATGPVAIEGVFTITKVTADTFVQGQILFWDDSAKKLTETVSTNKPVAICMEVAGGTATTCKAKLHPMTKDTTA